MKMELLSVCLSLPSIVTTPAAALQLRSIMFAIHITAIKEY